MKKSLVLAALVLLAPVISNGAGSAQSSGAFYGAGGGAFSPAIDTSMADDTYFGLGDDADYQLEYDSANTELQLYSASLAADVLTIDDGTDDVDFNGSWNLKIGEKGILDADGTGNDYLFADTDGSVRVYADGASITQWQSAYTRQYKPVQFDANAHINNNTKLQVGGSDYSTPYYWQTYNSTGTQFEFWSTDTDAGGGLDGLVFHVDDGTDDVVFAGNVALSNGEFLGNASDGKLAIGGSGGTNDEDLVFDFETTANKILLTSTTGANQINTSIYWGGPVNTTVQSSFGNVLMGGFLRMYDGHQIRLGTGDDQSLVYTDGTGVTWSDGTNTVLTVADDSGLLSTNAGRNIGTRIIDVDDSPYTVLGTDEVLIVDTDSGTGAPAVVTVNLPPAACGVTIGGTEKSSCRIIRIKNIGGTSNVTVDADGAEEIDDATTQALTPGTSVTLIDANQTDYHWIIE